MPESRGNAGQMGRQSDPLRDPAKWHRYDARKRHPSYRRPEWATPEYQEAYRKAQAELGYDPDADGHDDGVRP